MDNYYVENDSDRILGVLAHASAFFAPFLVPLILMLVSNSSFVRHHAKQSFLFHVLMAVAFAVAFVLLFVLVGVLIYPVLGIMYIICSVIGIMRALDGRTYRYPIVGWFTN